MIVTVLPVLPPPPPLSDVHPGSTRCVSFMNSVDLSPYNTRLFKLDDATFELRLASAATGDKDGLSRVAAFEGALLLLSPRGWLL